MLTGLHCALLALAPLAAPQGNPWYPEGRPPLRPRALAPLPPGAVQPRGWLREQLRLMAEGMHGRLDEISPWTRFEGSAWSDPKGQGANGWEELPYWLKGFEALGHVLGDEAILDRSHRWVEAILASQQENGWFGPARNREARDLWPNMVALWVLRTHAEAAGDPRVLPFVLRYLRWVDALPEAELLPGSWQKIRGGDLLDIVHWAWERSGEEWLLPLAAKVHRRTADWTGGVASWHGVNICQGFREPAQFWRQSGEERHLRATYRDYEEVMARFGQVPGGMFGADENAREGHDDPRQAAEACSMVEMMLSCEMLARITGDLAWADRCEEVAFNSLPAAFTPDLKGLHYLTAPNTIRLDHENHAPGVENGGCMLAYSAGGRYRCCQHNVSHGWPYYTQSLWAATPDRGLAALLLAPSEVRARVGAGDGVEVRIVEETAYPFGEELRFTVHAPRPVAFPLRLRVPGWCEGATAVLPGGGEQAGRPGAFLTVEREWRDGDQVVLRLPMEIRVRRWEAHGGAVSVYRGPLAWSLFLPEHWQRNGGSDAWPEWDVLPEAAWNYAVVLDEADPAASFEVEEVDRPLKAQPFVPDGPPLRLWGRFRRVPEWQEEWGLAGELQESPVRCQGPVERLPLIPMGCARLRLTVLPVAAPEGEGHVWTPPPTPPPASWYHDDPFAIQDGILPSSSADHSIPRFTWWPRLGTVEWIERRFPEPRTFHRAAVYWFDDTGIGRCRVPASWRLLWRDGEKWREVPGASGYGTAKDRFNEVEFDPVTTDALRLEVRLQEDMSGGVLEWRVE